MRSFVEIMLNLSLFANRLYELMLENNLNITELADKLEVDKSTVSRYLSDDKAPSVENIVKLANIFDCKIDYILGIKDDDTKTTFKKCPQFSKRLAFLLENKKKTQYALKKQTKISQSLLYYWLHDKYTPSLDNVVKLAKFFDCSVDYLLGRIDYE